MNFERMKKIVPYSSIEAIKRMSITAQKKTATGMNCSMVNLNRQCIAIFP